MTAPLPRSQRLPEQGRPLTLRGSLRGSLWALAALMMVAVNLRFSIAAVGPVLDEVRAELALARPAAGLLTTLPVLCFGVLAPLAAYAARRFGSQVVLVASMAALVLGILLRSAGDRPWLFAGTLLLGAGAAAGNVLVPALVKQDLVPIAGVAMALYTAMLTGGAALAAWGTALVFDLGWSWRWALAAGAVPALLGLVLYAGWARGRLRVHEDTSVAAEMPEAGVWRSSTAWSLAAFFAGQSFVFYAFLAWLPVMLQDEGVSLTVSGQMLSLYSLLGIVGALVVPPLAVRRSDHRALAAVCAGGWLAGIAGLLLAPPAYLLWTLLLGVTQGAGIGMALTLVVLRARSNLVARSLSGMVQMVGYLVAALGPLLMGALRDRTGSWQAPLLLLLGVAATMLLAALGAGRDRKVG